MDLKDLDILYKSLLGLGMTTIVMVLKCNSQNSKCIHALAIHTNFLRQVLSMTSGFRCLQET